MLCSYIADKMQRLEAAFPDKPIVIAEVGWPSDGRTRESAVASLANQALFLRRFLDHARRADYSYYLMEAFDQPWKERSEGASRRVLGRIRRRSGAEVQVHGADRARAGLARARRGLGDRLGAAARTLLLPQPHPAASAAAASSPIVVFATATLVTWILYDLSQQYVTATSVLVGAVLLVGMIGVIAVLLAEAHEWAEAHWVTSHGRILRPGMRPAATARPKVSIDVPAYAEPPAMLIATLDALAQLDYPDFEVLVVDNNTRDESLWRPVQAHCRKLGPRFRFFHVDPLPGYKAGALNFALDQTAADAEVVAAIDADYVVRPEWLRDLVPAFANPRTGIVQAPQDYRDADESAFKAMCFAEYRGFFHIGMVTRNERNAIIQHGTMTAGAARTARADPLGGVVHHRGRGARPAHPRRGLRERAYTPRSYGRGLMPEQLPRLQEAALPLGVRLDADHAAAPRAAHARAVTGA